MKFNWIPSDPYGQIWKLVCFIEDKDPENYSYFLLAEVKKTDSKKWKWKLFTKKTDKYPSKRNWGYSFDKYEAIENISKICKIAC